MVWGLLAAGLGLLVIAGIGVRRGLTISLGWRGRVAMWLSAALVGCGIGSTFWYTPEPDTRIIGFPLPAAVFQREGNGPWTDFVGPMTGPFMVANCVIWTGVVLFLVASVLAYARVRSAKTVQ